ncbi:hypothetical protein N9A04_00340 [Rickettsiales bacterium]|nr:hypothetical protein [Rickettsiales bacterium]
MQDNRFKSEEDSQIIDQVFVMYDCADNVIDSIQVKDDPSVKLSELNEVRPLLKKVSNLQEDFVDPYINNSNEDAVVHDLIYAMRDIINSCDQIKIS